MLNFNNPTIKEVSSKEWIITNGIGGYASSTVCGMNTRRYHGLLVASFNPPTDRRVLISKIEESISNQRDCSVEISSNQYQEVYHPKGWQYLKTFSRMPFPKMVYEVGVKQVTKTIYLAQNSNTTIVEYENTGQKGYLLSLRPLLVNRDYHGLMQENDWYDFYLKQEGNVIKVHPHYGSSPVFMRFSKGEFKEERFWIKDVTYYKEGFRGLDDKESTYSIGAVQHFLEPGEKIYLLFSTEDKQLYLTPEMIAAQQPKEEAEDKKRDLNQFYKDLGAIAKQFIVKRKSTDNYTIIAGYHWFTDWGRDTMIAMRGLVNELGEREVAKSILKTFLDYLDKGMLPNRFPDQGEEPEYNTIDATLWLFVVLYDFYQKFGEGDFIREYFHKLESVMNFHINGTRYNIHLTKKGFLFGGEHNAQLTWMDARVGDYVVTPRHGCPVEINALWYNALKITAFFIEELAIETKITATIQRVISKLETNFSEAFFNEKGYLNDVVLPDGTTDDSIRPNQIYVLNLPFELLDRNKAISVLETVEQHLLTPYGLRSLSPEHPDFKPVYNGSPWDRDTAYHQGTVWAFLLGEYLMAYLNLHGINKASKAYVTTNLQQIMNHFYEQDCIYGISEIFDGLHPAEGRGTIHQAWSVGTLLPVLKKILA